METKNGLGKIWVVVCCTAFGILTAWWAGMMFFGLKNSPANYWYNIVVGLLYCLGGGLGVYYGKKKQTEKEKALFFLGIGQAAWGIAALIWGWYNVFSKVETPYPSVADLFFVTFTVSVGVGMVHLIDYIKPKISLSGNIIGLPVILLVTYGLISWVYFSPEATLSASIMAILLNFFYPIGDALLFSGAWIIYQVTRENDANRAIYYLTSGLMFQVFGDLLFTYRTSRGIYWNADMSDFLYSVSSLLITMGIIKIASRK